MAIDCTKITDNSSTWLKYGSHSSQVGELQKILQALGYYSKSIDNDFKGYTQEGVKKFQQKNNLQTDGQVGSKTCPRINKAYEDYLQKQTTTTTTTTTTSTTTTTGDKSDTGWKIPRTVKQDNRKAINNGGTCYAFENLNNILQNDDTYSRIPNSGGITKTYKSPYVYAYDYGFTLPSNATVTKISCYIKCQQISSPNSRYNQGGKLVGVSISKFCHMKLKTGTSLIDGGIGNDRTSSLSNVMLPYQKWTTEAEGVFSGTPTEWGINNKDLVSTINSGNFGCVVQFVGTVDKGWVDPAIAQMKMKIEYTTPQVKPVTPSSFHEDLHLSYVNREGKTTNITLTKKQNNEIHNDDNHLVTGLQLDNVANPISLIFKFKHIGASHESPYLELKSSSLYFGENNSAYINSNYKRVYSLPSIQCGKDESLKEYSQSVAIYPGDVVGKQKISFVWSSCQYNIYFNVENPSDLDEEDMEYVNKDCKCIISNCYYDGNTTLGQGACNYISSEYYSSTTDDKLDKHIFKPEGNIYKSNNVAGNKYNEGSTKCHKTFWSEHCDTR